MDNARSNSPSAKPWWIIPAAGVLAGALALAVAAANQSTPAIAEGDQLTAPTLRTPGDFSAPVLHIRGGDSSEVHTSIPQLGPKTAAQIPQDTQQVIVSSSPKNKDTAVTTTLYERTDGGWQQKLSFAGHNGEAGWKEKRKEGDLSTPAGVFTLTDAGGYLPDPGTKMPYTQDKSLRGSAQAVYGDDYTQVYDYVLAIDYNRKTGVPPTDRTRPQGKAPGGGIWLHVDHGNSTHGCVTVDREDMGTILKALDPDKNPMIAMGSADFLAR